VIRLENECSIDTLKQTVWGSSNDHPKNKIASSQNKNTECTYFVYLPIKYNIEKVDCEIHAMHRSNESIRDIHTTDSVYNPSPCSVHMCSLSMDDACREHTEFRSSKERMR
jgi:hypothetical protein